VRKNGSVVDSRIFFPYSSSFAAALCALAEAAVKLATRQAAMADKQIFRSRLRPTAANSHNFPLGILIITSPFIFLAPDRLLHHVTGSVQQAFQWFLSDTHAVQEPG
jgi:hypothetical protein